MITELFGKRFFYNLETKMEANYNINNDTVSVVERNIRGNSVSTPYNTIKIFGVDSNVFCDAFNSAFKEHNYSVDKNLADLKEKTIQKIKDFCEDWYLDERKKYLNSRVQTDIYDVNIEGQKIRFAPNFMCFFTEHLAPIIFDISREDFDMLEKLYLKKTRK